MNRRCLSTFAFLTVFGVSVVASGQTTTTAQSTAPALPDARGIAAACGTLPPADRPLPALTGPARLEYQRLMLSATADFNAGRFATALRWQWAAYMANPVPEAANQLVVYLTAAGASAEGHRCAIVSCLAPRATGAQRAELEAERDRCNPSAATPVATQRVETFSLTGEMLLAVRANPALTREIVHDPSTLNVTMAGHVEELLVPVVYRPRINAALEVYRRTHSATVTPNPRLGRSTFGYALPISLWGAGALALVGGVVSTTNWSANNALLDAANRGETNTGWPRQAEADAQNAGTRAIVFYTGAALLVAGGTVTWFLLAPRQSTSTTAPARPRAALIPSFAPDHVGAVLTGSF